MNRSLLFLLGATLLVGIVPLRSQSPQPAPPLQRMEAMKAQNEKLLETQAATLQKLDELMKEAQQLRIFARRT